MISASKTLMDVHKRSRIFTPKVNIRQYLTNKREPVETISDITPANIDHRSGIVKDASPGRKAFRRLALTLRFGHKI
jgi:hypothetical protein